MPLIKYAYWIIIATLILSRPCTAAVRILEEEARPGKLPKVIEEKKPPEEEKIKKELKVKPRWTISKKNINASLNYSGEYNDNYFLDSRGNEKGNMVFFHASIEVNLEGLSDKDVAPFIPKDALQNRGFQDLSIRGNFNGSLAKGISGNLQASINLLPENKKIELKTAFDAQKFSDLNLQEFSLQLGQAEITAKGKVGPLSASADQLLVDLTLNVKGLNGEKLTAFVPREAFQGIGFQSFSVDGNLKGLGNSRTNIEQTLTRNAKVEVKEGKIVGSNLKAQVLQKMDNPILKVFIR